MRTIQANPADFERWIFSEPDSRAAFFHVQALCGIAGMILLAARWHPACEADFEAILCGPDDDGNVAWFLRSHSPLSGPTIARMTPAESLAFQKCALRQIQRSLFKPFTTAAEWLGPLGPGVPRRTFERWRTRPFPFWRLARIAATHWGTGRPMDTAETPIPKRWPASLPPEVVAALENIDPNKSIPPESVEEILRVPVELREQAVQLVLHPSFQFEPLRPAQARGAIYDLLVRPARAEAEWEGARVAVTAEWVKRLKKLVGKELRENVAAVSVGYGARVNYGRGMAEAEECVPQAECSPEAPVPLTWAKLSARHGLAVKVVPGEDGGRSKVLVSMALLRLAEKTLAEHGGVAWLALAARS